METLDEIPQEERRSKGAVLDNSQRAKTLILVFSILAALTAIGVISGYFELQLLERMKAGEYVTDEEINVNDLRQGVIGIIQTILYIGSIIVFLNWFRRAYANLHRSGTKGIEHKESMALWSWFIPIIVFFRPVQIMNEIWTKTQSRIQYFDTSYVVKSGGLIIGIWWFLFITSNFVGRYVWHTAFKTDTIEQIVEGTQAVLILDIMQVPEALLVILIVTQLSKMETKLAEVLGNNSENAFV
ncbi:MAG: DUF4328 domain-containing protein [Saprospiraceae bacterium]|nr:DUF4328 domain-containing protein [Saprospiraceae bacterium]